jgi:hypothetical protein
MFSSKEARALAGLIGQAEGQIPGVPRPIPNPPPKPPPRPNPRCHSPLPGDLL